MKTKPTIRRGSIYIVNLEPTVGGETQKQRPCVVLSIEPSHHGVVVVAPLLTFQKRHLHSPNLFQKIEPDAINGFDKARTVDIYQVRAVDPSRFAKEVDGSYRVQGRLSDEEIDFAADALYLTVKP